MLTRLRLLPHASRVRKLRCDSAQPTCYNCQRAADKTHHRTTKGRVLQCVYPAGPPKRRGADKAQRIRSPIGQRQPRSAPKAALDKGGKGKEREREGTVSASDGGDASGPSLPGTPDD